MEEDRNFVYFANYYIWFKDNIFFENNVHMSKQILKNDRDIMKSQQYALGTAPPGILDAQFHLSLRLEFAKTRNTR